MKFIADLHIHSSYSRATSSDLTFEQLYKWAQLKGIQVVGSGDITHPKWLEEMKTKLEPAEEGFFRLKEEFANAVKSEIPKTCRNEVRFALSGEISNIYKKGDRVRKNHNVIFLPSFDVAKKFQTELDKIGNIHSDGRPILGLDARNLLELTLESHPLSFLIPAHIWTPWFSVLGSKSGFDSIDACFDDLTSHIFALETGLSSDPPMNWRLSQLDRYTLVSNSDAHSPAKLGREANLFDCEFNYAAMLDAIKSGDPARFLGTIEFFPEEGKYHADGHRKCNARMNPAETKSHRGLCPVCGKPVTVGVLNRVEELADRPDGARPANARPFYSLIPLPEVLAEIYNVGPATKTVKKQYDKLLNKIGPEMAILFDAPLSEIERWGDSLLAEGIRRMRTGEVKIAAGYDGEFGTITLFTDLERKEFSAQAVFFKEDETRSSGKKTVSTEQLSIITEEPPVYRAEGESGEKEAPAPGTDLPSADEDETGLNGRQREAVQCVDSHALIIAGPGTGKTRTLTFRIADLIRKKQTPPDQILAITFTNRAAGEMRDRLYQLLDRDIASRITVKTFHAFGALILYEQAQILGNRLAFSIYGENEKIRLLRKLNPGLSAKEINELGERISQRKNLMPTDDDSAQADSEPDESFDALFANYEKILGQLHAYDFDDLIVRPIHLFRNQPKILKKYQERFQWISVDEYQDINAGQYQLLRQLIARKSNLCAIGDPDQAIYGFRGSDRKYFLQFERDFPGTKVFTLEKNYRSVSTILDASRQVIARNSDHQSLAIWSPLVSKMRIDTFSVPTEKAEAETIVHQVERIVGGTSFFSVDSGRTVEGDSGDRLSFSDIAVLFRLGAQVKPIEEAFLRSGIPFQTLGEVPFYEIPEVREIISFLKIIHNPHSDLDLYSVINVPPRGIGEHTLNTVLIYQKTNELSLWTAMERISRIAVLSETQKNPIESFVSRVKELQHVHHEFSIRELVDKIVAQFGLNSYFKNDKKRHYYWDQIKELNADFGGNLSEFLERVMLQKETDALDPRVEKVSLMTLHAAKGLEFPVVFIAGCEEGLIPYQRGDGAPADVEEERRLFYVGMTRAKERLILLGSKSRFLFGERKSNSPSRFLADIQEALKQHRKAELKDRPKVKTGQQDASQLTLF
ncbi:MAG: UvrD-helicase domain-containing protein [Candidatus Zhuqueibacterota bacterium]